MDYVNLGSSGLKVSRLCLGTMTFGRQADEATSTRILDTALEAGVNFIDSADAYPVPPQLDTAGHTEEIIGRWLRGRRDQVIVATKCRMRVGPGVNDEGLSRRHIIAACEASLRRLQTDYIDLYQPHSPDNDTPLDETMEALDSLVSSGKVRYLGCCNFEAWRLGLALESSTRLGTHPFVCLQPRYNLLYREPERELLPLCQHAGLGVIPYNPLSAGMLTGKYRKGLTPPEGSRFSQGQYGQMYQQRYWNDQLFDIVDRVLGIATEADISPSTLAVAWLLAQPAVTSPILGATRPEQLGETLAAAQVSLPDHLLDALDQATAGLR